MKTNSRYLKDIILKIVSVSPSSSLCFSYKFCDNILLIYVVTQALYFTKYDVQQVKSRKTIPQEHSQGLLAKDYC